MCFQFCVLKTKVIQKYFKTIKLNLYFQKIRFNTFSEHKLFCKVTNLI